MIGAAEMGGGLKTLAALPEDLGMILSIHIVSGLQLSETPVPGDTILSGFCEGTRHAKYQYVNVAKILVHTIK